MSRISDAELPADMSAMMQNNLNRALYNNPPMAGDFGVIAKGVHSSSHIDHRTRELVVLRVAATTGSNVEWAQHFQVAQMVGVTSAERWRSGRVTCQRLKNPSGRQSALPKRWKNGG